MTAHDLQITQIELYKLFIPLKEPFVISLGPIYNAENIIAVIRTNIGISGFGECSPFMTINGETQSTCFSVGEILAKKLKGKNPLNIEDCMNMMDKTIYGNHSIKSAFDIALYDIASQHTGVPLYKFLGGKKDKKLITDYTVSIGNPEKMASDALKIKKAGYQVIKVKLGESKETDVARIKAIRKAIGGKIPIRIDANQGWDAKTAIKVLQALKDYNIQYCEEPIPRWDYLNLKKVKKKSPIPIMADESCCDHHDAERLIQLRSCDMFNLKLGKSSGLLKAKKIIALAEKENMKMQVGGFMESKIAMTANAHLALSSKNILYCDFDTPLMFAEDPVSGGIIYKENGIIDVPETVGLGAWIAKERLEKLEKIIV
ncbi:dipeptide epimerase [Ginsengibacter hankyongi]|uniref:Dipeptide epimerase n=1 Tax=Ginsengibacter hankyongi TaxID=2607284 RepID=A0A5J5IFN9_9BACT|nr:dipeptide epimerase [Ginsengibacter hankyongi]KAA9037669.1 dipeptide epimerase [Ginsengibacter hankyongi]